MSEKQVRAQRRKYHYIYKTVCVISNRYYIGMHSTDNLKDGYIGSGTRLWYSINKHGKENHKVEIIEFLENREKLKIREKEIVNPELLKDPMCLNLKEGGEGGWDYENSNSEIQKAKNFKGLEKQKDLRLNDLDWSKKVSTNMSNGQKLSYINGRIPNTPTPSWTGRTHSIITKERMSQTNKERGNHIGTKNSQYGKMWIYSDDLKQCKKILKTDLIPDGWNKGRKMKF